MRFGRVPWEHKGACGLPPSEPAEVLLILQGPAQTSRGDMFSKPSVPDSRFPPFALDTGLLRPVLSRSAQCVCEPCSWKGRAVFSSESSQQLEPPPHPLFQTLRSYLDRCLHPNAVEEETGWASVLQRRCKENGQVQSGGLAGQGSSLGGLPLPRLPAPGVCSPSGLSRAWPWWDE